MNDWSDRSDALPAADREGRRRLGVVALRISAIYFLVGMLWVGLSDEALKYLVSATGDPLGVFSRLEMIKGFFFVAVTTVLLFVLVRAFTRSNYAMQLQARKTLLRIAEDYHVLFRRNPLPMWVYEPETLRILAVNEQAMATYGYSQEEFVGMRITELRPEEEVAELLRVVASLQDRPQFSGPLTHRKKSGEPFSVEVISHAIEFSGKSARLVMALDVTNRLRAEKSLEEYRSNLEHRVAERTADLSDANQNLQREVEEREKMAMELRGAKQIAEEASTAKSVFVANTTHEIRTPLTSILGYADLLLDGGLPQEQRERYVLVLRQNASHLLKMIDDLLDLSRIETGNLRFTLDDYSPREIAEQTLELLRPRAVEKGLVLALDFMGELPEAIRTDGVRLRQVLLNLLSNAIKFTPSGRVSVVVRLSGHENSGGMRWIQFEVVDTGIGVEVGQRERIFEPFYQVDHGENRQYGGTGLGLAISRKLVEQMGGTLELTSELGRGSVFTVRIPLLVPLKVTQQARPVVEVESRIDGHVLLAEDNANIRWLVEEYLRRAGATVTVVNDGAEAVTAVRTAKRSRFDLVLLDINMPGMDGVEAMRRIREAGYIGPVVALTAHSGAEEQGRFMAAGWDAAAGKPINRHTFIPLIARLIGERRQAAVQQ